MRRFHVLDVEFMEKIGKLKILQFLLLNIFYFKATNGSP